MSWSKGQRSGSVLPVITKNKNFHKMKIQLIIPGGQLCLNLLNLQTVNLIESVLNKRIVFHILLLKLLQ
jgi:hypothetical protein